MFFYTFMPKLWNMSLTASVAIGFVLLLRLLLKKAPKVISYALWSIVLFRLLCPVSIESTFSLFSLFDTPTTESSQYTSSITYVPEDIVHIEYPEVVLPVPGVSDVINDALPEGEEQLRADPLEAPMTIATYVWMAGVLVMAVYAAVSYLKLKRKLITASPLRDNIYLADEITSPFVMGLIQPKIYLPSSLEEREQSYILLHEQHHIRRLDHIVKAVAFVALCIHWFNPLVWLAFILAGKDMEMSCDEAVVKKMGEDIRADYTASLLSLATGKRIIAGMPLAFGEGDTKGRIHNLANWRKPAFWVILVAIIACLVLGVCLLTNPASSTFPMDGNNLADIEPQKIVDEMTDILNLGKNASALHITADKFAMNVTADFDYAYGQAIRVFYSEGQQTYSAQLRIFPEENEYFVKEPKPWNEQKYRYLFQHYLEAMKYLPQAQIREISPDADQYTINLVTEGTPDSYDRSISYSSYGVGGIDGWYIHLEIQPLHEQTDGGYIGVAEEVIHVFYGDGKTGEAE